MRLLLDPDETHILAHAGWGDDHRWLWRDDITTGEETRLAQFEQGFRLCEA